jgi:N-acetyl-anhydromuramyl-L-alanine amidase AmpD
MSQITVSLGQVERSVNLTCDRLGAFEAEWLQQALAKYGYQMPVQDIGGGEWKSKLLRDFWDHNGASSERKFYERFEALML